MMNKPIMARTIATLPTLSSNNIEYHTRALNPSPVHNLYNARSAVIPKVGAASHKTSSISDTNFLFLLKVLENGLSAETTFKSNGTEIKENPDNAADAEAIPA